MAKKMKKKRQRKPTDIKVADPPSRGLEILVNGPQVTMDHVRVETAEFGRQVRNVLGDLVDEIVGMVATGRDELKNAATQLAKAAPAPAP